MHSVVLKNDAVGDLVHSIGAINNITSSNENKRVTIFLSNLSKNFSFLINSPKAEFKILNYDLSLIEKIKLIFFLKKNDVEKVYVLTPKSFYYILPLIFRKIKFYAICINNINNYKRPNLFFRKFLFKYEINDREKIFRRDSTKEIQDRLTNSKNEKFIFNVNIKKSTILSSYLPNDYIYFHFKKKIFQELNWEFNELEKLFNEFSKYSSMVVFTKDIENDSNNILFKKKFNSYDFKFNKFTNNNKKILFLDNIVGEDLFNVIKYSKKVVAFHGMMTNLASLLRKPVLDLFHCNIKTWTDYRRYRNSFYEFKPKYYDYDFIIPKKNINKTISKIKFALKK